MQAAVAEGLVTAEEGADLLKEMEAVTADPRTLVVMPRFVHAFGRSPEAISAPCASGVDPAPSRSSRR